MSPTGNREQFNLQFSCLLGSWVLAIAQSLVMHQRTGPRKQPNPETVSPTLGKQRRRAASLQEAPDWRCGERKRRSLSQSLVCPFPKAHNKESSREYCGGRSSCQTLIRGEKNPMRMLGAKRRHVDFDLCRSWLYCGVFWKLAVSPRFEQPAV